LNFLDIIEFTFSDKQTYKDPDKISNTIEKIFESHFRYMVKKANPDGIVTKFRKRLEIKKYLIKGEIE